MKTFMGGQIQQEHRGQEAAIVTRNNNEYGAHLCSPFDADFIYLTGMGTVKQPIERVYLGISHEAARHISREVSLARTTLDLQSLDNHLIIPHFLASEPQAPQRIALELQGTEYKIASQQ